MIHWIVLTGGASSRFGRDKATAQLVGRSLIDRAMDAIREVDPTATISVVGSERSGGPASAVVSTLPEVDADYLGVLAVDMPFARDALAAVMTACCDQVDEPGANEQRANEQRADAWVPEDATGRRQWLCAVYRRQSLAEVARAHADWSSAPFHRLVADLPTIVVSVPTSVSLLDIDTPEDFQRARDVATELES